jgi:membrane-bound lytic murein transglycosylase MltF
MNVAVFAGQIHQESLWKAGARSRFASGMTQFTPGTAKDMQAGSSRLKELCANAGGCPLDPAWALRAMVIYDRDLWAGLSAFPAADERLAATLVAYNGGPGWVEKERLRCYDNRSSTEPCDAGRWFGHVERYCLRSAAACAESRHYPRVILQTLAPQYDAWLQGGRP